MFRWGMGTDPTWRELERLQRDMNNLLGAFTGTRRPFVDHLWREVQLFPLLNVRELDQSFVVTAEIPGMKTDDLDIKIEGDTLTLRGARKPHEIAEQVSYHRRERATGTFQRSLSLPAKVDTENVKATYKDGVLTVTLQKQAAAQPRHITVKTE